MKKISLALFLFTIGLHPSCAQEQKSKNQKVLIVYVSRTNNTKVLAQMIHNEVGGDLVALELENPYPEDYDEIVKQVEKENETGFLPPLKTKIDIDKYDVVFIGFPTWGMQLPPPMKSFLDQYDLSSKTIIPFNTNAGYGIGRSIETVKKLCPNSEILEEISIKGGIEKDGIYLTLMGERRNEVTIQLTEWLTKIGICEGNK